MYYLFYGFARVDVSLELLKPEEGVTINPSPGRDPKVLMTGYPLSFLREGVHLNKQYIHFSTQLCELLGVYDISFLTVIYLYKLTARSTKQNHDCRRFHQTAKRWNYALGFLNLVFNLLYLFCPKGGSFILS